MLPVLLLQVFACLSSFFNYQVSADLSNFSLLNARTFSVRSRIRNWQEDPILAKSFKVKSELTETYSNDQRRGIIDYESQRINSSVFLSSLKSESGKLIIDRSELNLSLLIDDVNNRQQEAKYQLLEVDEIYNRLQLEAFNFQLDDGNVIPNYIIGPTRLLFLVEQHKNQLKFVQLDQVHGSKSNCFPSIKYQLNGENKSWGKFELIVFYREQPEDTSARDTNTLFPDRVSILWFDKPEFSNSSITVDFAQIEVNLSPLGPLHSAAQLISCEEVLFDQFLIDPSIGSTEVLKAKAKSPLANSYNLQRFVFKAELRYSSDQHNPIELNRFIAFDSQLNSMRVDDSSNEWKLYNFNYNRIYHLKNDNADFTDMLSLIGEDSQESFQYKSKADCVISSVSPIKVLSSSFPTNRMERILFGTEKFVHLGKAKVRGIDAQVYEAELDDGQLPIWLEIPIEAIKDNKSANDSPLEESKDKHSKQYSIFLYLATNDEQLERRVPLSMELIEFRKTVEGSVKILSHLMIHIREFEWNFDSIVGLNGDLPSQLFSLNGLCSNPMNSRAQVEMFLESKLPGPMNEMLKEKPIERDLAIIEALQNGVEIPPTLIQDLEVKVIQYKRAANYTVALAVAFSVIEHDQISMKPKKILGVSMVTQRRDPNIATFEDCFLEAAHIGNQIVFGYDDLKRICYLQANAVSLKPGPVQVYKIQQDEDRMYAAKVHELQTKSKLSARYNIVGMKVDLKAFGDFKLTRFNVKVSEPSKRISYNNNQEATIDEQKIIGFNLLQDDERNDRIDSSTSRSDLIKPMSVNKCKSICDSDLNCNSYSICVRGYQVHCTTSSIWFNMSALNLELLSQQVSNETRRKVGAKIKVKVEGEQVEDVELEVHPNCELRAKSYLSYFNDPLTIGYGNFEHEPIATSSGPEDCAKICALAQFSVIKTYANKANELTLKLLSSDNSQNDQQTNQEDDKLHATECSEFMYLDVAKLDKTEALKLKVQDSATKGFCMVNKPNYLERGQVSDCWAGVFHVDRYKFKTELLYEEQYGFALKASPKSTEESVAYLKLRDLKGELDSESMEKVRGFMQSAKNSQTVWPGMDKAACASLCLHQVGAPWPACKSFDIHVIMAGETAHTTCNLNSITLFEAMTQDFDGNNSVVITLDGNHSKSAMKHKQIWHYEPLLEFIEFTDGLSKRRINDSTSATGYRIIEFTLGIVAILTGLLIGYMADVAMKQQQRAGRQNAADFRRESTLNFIERTSKTFDTRTTETMDDDDAL